MDVKKINLLSTAHNTILRRGPAPTNTLDVLEEVYDTAHQYGRESLLRAAKELIGGRSILDTGTDLEAVRGQQVLKSLDFLKAFMKLDPKHNRYDVGQACYERPGGNNYRVTVWRKPFYLGMINAKDFWGTSDIDALANAAQSVAAEVEEARAKK
jgi:hypothetical protein